jgi:phosphotriesterase-related protein
VCDRLTEIADSELKFLKAACIAQAETGVAIITHTTSGVLGPEQQTILEESGIPLRRVVIGHCCENPDASYHRRLLDRGSYVGFDRIGWSQFQSDEIRADTLAELIRAGYSGQIMLGQDRFTAMIGRHGRTVSREEAERIEQSKRSGRWPPPYSDLFDVFFPMLVERNVPLSTLYGMLDENPKRFFAGHAIPVRTRERQGG